MTTYNTIIKKRNPTNNGWDTILPITTADNVLVDGEGHSVATKLLGFSSHMAESMPHQFAVGATKYKYGFKINQAKDGLIFIYEEA